MDRENPLDYPPIGTSYDINNSRYVNFSVFFIVFMISTSGEDSLLLYVIFLLCIGWEGIRAFLGPLDLIVSYCQQHLLGPLLRQ